MNKLSRNIYLIGMPGCGKSSLGRRVAASLQIPYVDTDIMLSQLLKMDTKQIFEKHGEKAFRNAETNLLIYLSSMRPGIISTGGGIPMREINQKIMHDNGYVVLIDRPLEDIKSNIRLEKRPLLVQKGLTELERIYNIRMPIYKSAADVSFSNTQGFQEGLRGLARICKSQMFY